MERIAVNPCRWVFAILEVAFPVTIISIINRELSNVTWYYNVNVVTYECLLGSSSTGESLCDYGYAVTAVSLWVTLMLSLTICCACGEYGNLFMDLALTLFGWGWWLAASIVFTKYNNEGNQENDAATSWRNAITGLCWTMFVVFLFDFLFGIFNVLFYKYGKFGGAAAKAERDERRRAEEAEAQRAQVMLGGAGGYPGYPPAPGAYPGYPPAPGGYAGYPPPPAGYAPGGPPAPAGYAPPINGYSAAQPAVELGEFKPPANTGDIKVNVT